MCSTTAIKTPNRQANLYGMFYRIRVGCPRTIISSGDINKLSRAVVVNEREREGAMSELIQAVVTIKDPFTLFAFLAVILLIAFRTKTVPESMFKLVRAKITRDRFYALLNRAMLSAVAIFLVLCGIAVLGQLLNYKTAVRAASVEDLKEELALLHADDTAARHALEEYQKGLALAQDQKLSDAISSLESSTQSRADGRRTRDACTPVSKGR